MYKYKKYSFLSIRTSGFRKYRPDMRMSNNYILLNRFLAPCRIVCFVVHFDYFIILCGETTTSVMCDIALERYFNYLLYGILQVQIG